MINVILSDSLSAASLSIATLPKRINGLFILRYAELQLTLLHTPSSYKIPHRFHTKLNTNEKMWMPSNRRYFKLKLKGLQLEGSVFLDFLYGEIARCGRVILQ